MMRTFLMHHNDWPLPPSIPADFSFFPLRSIQIKILVDLGHHLGALAVPWQVNSLLGKDKG